MAATTNGVVGIRITTLSTLDVVHSLFVIKCPKDRMPIPLAGASSHGIRHMTDVPH